MTKVNTARATLALQMMSTMSPSDKALFVGGLDTAVLTEIASLQGGEASAVPAAVKLPKVYKLPAFNDCITLKVSHGGHVQLSAKGVGAKGPRTLHSMQMLMILANPVAAQRWALSHIDSFTFGIENGDEQREAMAKALGKELGISDEQLTAFRAKHKVAKATDK